MKLYKCKEKKTGCYLCFEGEVLVSSSKELFLYLMREANNNLRISGGVPFFVTDYIFEEFEVGQSESNSADRVEYEIDSFGIAGRRKR